MKTRHGTLTVSRHRMCQIVQPAGCLRRQCTRRGTLEKVRSHRRRDGTWSMARRVMQLLGHRRAKERCLADFARAPRRHPCAVGTSLGIGKRSSSRPSIGCCHAGRSKATGTVCAVGLSTVIPFATPSRRWFTQVRPNPTTTTSFTLRHKLGP